MTSQQLQYYYWDYPDNKFFSKELLDKCIDDSLGENEVRINGCIFEIKASENTIMRIKERIEQVLLDNRFHSFESILAGVIATQLNDPHINEKSVRLCLDIKDEVWKCLQEMLSYGKIEYSNGFRKKKNETNTSGSDQS